MATADADELDEVEELLVAGDDEDETDEAGVEKDSLSLFQSSDSLPPQAVQPPPLFARLRRHLSAAQREFVASFPLHSACSIGGVEEAASHLDRVNDADCYGNAPLYWAVKRRDADVVELLLSAGADVEVSGANKVLTPLLLALKLGAASVARLLIEGGAKVDAKDANGISALHYAVVGGKLSSLQILLSNGADPNSSSTPDRTTPLHLVCGADCPVMGPRPTTPPPAPPTATEMARALVADPRTNCKARDGAGRTPLHVAAEQGRAEVAQSLLLAVLEWRNLDATTPSLPSTLTSILEAHNPQGRTPLHFACVQNDVPLTETFISFGADVNAQDLHKNAPLHIAARQESTALISLLLDAGADPTRRDHEGAAPLHVAVAESRDVGVIHSFLCHGADPNAQETESLMTPVHLAASMGNYEALEVLLQCGADVNLLTASQQNPLHQAVNGCHGEICKHFVTDRLHRFSVCTSGVHPSIIALLLSFNAYVDHQDNYGFTPLTLACRYGLVDAAQVLVKAGASLFLRDHLGHDAFVSCRLVSNDDRKALFNLLFRAGFLPSPSHLDRLKGSPLSFLIRHFDEHNVRLLIQCGYRLSGDRDWRPELAAGIRKVEMQPPEEEEEANEDSPRRTTPEEGAALLRIRDFLEMESSAPPSLWLLTRAAIRRRILRVVQASDGSRGQREAIWSRVERLPVPDPIKAWLKLDPTKYNDPE